ncbi:MAG: hypothetical protein JWL72_2156 [Ilumatobacteraceae bacterium]|nr:hypothetical protein [Ilumatobacteraceae bacterium]MCU1388818.1 hypothetical protein [Ilumatobacteraceae bacterium]
MSAVDALAAANAPGTSTGSADIFGGMGPDAFLKLLVAQLRYQNPMNPSDPTAMMGQVAQYAQVESLKKMQQGQATEQSLSEAKMATEMVGRTITATDGSATETGRVMSARFTPTGPILVLDTGAEVTLSAVVTVAESPAAAATTAPPSTTTALASTTSTADAIAAYTAAANPVTANVNQL